VIHSEDGLEYVSPQHDTVFVLYDFSDNIFEVLYKKECRILGYSALLDIVSKKYFMPELDRPLFSISMENVVSCFTGFRNREEVVSCSGRNTNFDSFNNSSNVFINTRTHWSLASITWVAVFERSLTVTKLPTLLPIKLEERNISMQSLSIFQL
jgi:hypothetical protein